MSAELKLTSFLQSPKAELIDLPTIKANHKIPEFYKTNELLISQAVFVDMAYDAIGEILNTETTEPAIVMTDPMAGRTYAARHKKKTELLPEDQTIHFNRMAFAIELPQHQAEVNGRQLTLTVVGIKAYNLDNLGAKSQNQHFQLGIGFNVDVCRNMCIMGSGAKLNIVVNSEDALKGEIEQLLKNYNSQTDLELLQQLNDTQMTEEQFVRFLGRCRLYHALPAKRQKELATVALTDTQIRSVANGYYNDPHFKGSDSELSMWNFYNLLTGSARSSNVDMFMGRNVNAIDITTGIMAGMNGEGDYQWYLN